MRVLENLLSLPSLILLVGVIALAVSIIIVAVWVFKLNDRISRLTRMIMLEQRRTQEIARRIGIRVAHQVPDGSDAHLEADERTSRMRQQGARQQRRAPQNVNAAYREQNMEALSQQQYAQQMQVTPMQQTSAYEVQDYSSMIMDPAIEQVERQPRPRRVANLNQERPPQNGRRPSPQAQRATSAMRASFESASDAIRAQAYTEPSWLETHESRFENRRARQQNAARRREERQQAQLRRQAEEIVQNHMRQSEVAREYQQPVPDIPETRRAIYGDYGIPNANNMRY